MFDSYVSLPEFWLYGGFLKWGYSQIIHFYRIFHYKQSILGYPHFRKPPYVVPHTPDPLFPASLPALETAPGVERSAASQDEISEKRGRFSQ